MREQEEPLSERASLHREQSHHRLATTVLSLVPEGDLVYILSQQNQMYAGVSRIARSSSISSVLPEKDLETEDSWHRICDSSPRSSPHI